MDSSDLLGFLTSRQSVREFDSEPLTDDEIRYILDCASTSPSAGNLEAWDVVLVTDEETRLALAEAAFSQKHVEQAPAIFVICANYVRSMSRSIWFARSYRSPSTSALLRCLQSGRVILLPSVRNV